MVVLILEVALILVGLYATIVLRSLIKKVIGLGIVNSGIVILFVEFGSHTGSRAPILVEGITDVVDPVPQALMLTAIVIGIALTSLALVFAYRLHERYGTLDIGEIEHLSRAELEPPDKAHPDQGGHEEASE